MRIKYTTYDTRRDEDLIHLDTEQTNIMLLNPAYSYGSSLHPFIYGKVIAILHAEVAYVGDIAREGADYTYYPIEFLWVRWYNVIPSSSDSELDKAELLPIDHAAAHSFIDPRQVLRACHIIPDFDSGVRYEDGKGKSAIANDGSDWSKYFINRCVGRFNATRFAAYVFVRFVDRDMFMRYEWGLGVGHTYAYGDATAANQEAILLHGPTRCSTGHTAQKCAVGLAAGLPDGEKTVDRAMELEGVGEGDGEGEGSRHGADEGQRLWEDDDGEDSDDDLVPRYKPGYDSEEEKEFVLFGPYED